MFRTVPLSIIRSKLSANLYDIHHCCVYSEKLQMMDRGCPKHVEFYSKNKFEKLVHLVGFITITYNNLQLLALSYLSILLWSPRCHYFWYTQESNKCWQREGNTDRETSNIYRVFVEGCGTLDSSGIHKHVSRQ